MTDISQQRRTVRALELLGESHTAHERGDLAACDMFAAQARRDCGGDTVTLLLGGMQIGEIPRPGEDEWPHYLVQQIDALARNEEESPDA
jgi:hypothetical protein